MKFGNIFVNLILSLLSPQTESLLLSLRQRESVFQGFRHPGSPKVFSVLTLNWLLAVLNAPWACMPIFTTDNILETFVLFEKKPRLFIPSQHCTMCILGTTMALWSKAEIQKYTFWWEKNIFEAIFPMLF